MMTVVHVKCCYSQSQVMERIEGQRQCIIGCTCMDLDKETPSSCWLHWLYWCCLMYCMTLLLISNLHKNMFKVSIVIMGTLHIYPMFHSIIKEILENLYLKRALMTSRVSSHSRKLSSTNWQRAIRSEECTSKMALPQPRTSPLTATTKHATKNLIQA